MKCTVYIGTSLDGFIARHNGDIDWLVQYANEEAVHAYEEFISQIDAIIIGRGTFEKVMGFPAWPYEQKVFILSSSLKRLPEEFKEKGTILSLNPEKVLKHLSAAGYANIYVDGGKVIQDFLKEDLIDELIISKVPLLLGRGIPLFGELNKDLFFSHIRTEVQSNELVRSYYERKRNTRTTL